MSATGVAVIISVWKMVPVKFARVSSEASLDVFVGAPSTVLTAAGFVQRFSIQLVYRLTVSHFSSSSCRIDSSAWINHQLVLCDLPFVLVFLLTFSPSIWQNRAMAFSTVLLVACKWVPHTFRAPTSILSCTESLRSIGGEMGLVSVAALGAEPAGLTRGLRERRGGP